MVMKRQCTDIACCIMFGVFLLMMFAVSGFAVTNGDPNRIVTPFDTDGNECGQGNFAGYRYKYMLSSAANAASVCVAECPSNIPTVATEENQITLDCKVNSVVKTCPDSLKNPGVIKDTTQLLGFCFTSS
jgi:hypothetical protein